MVSWIEIGGFYAGHMGKERSRSRSALEARSAYNERYTFSDLGRMFFGRGKGSVADTALLHSNLTVLIAFEKENLPFLADG